MKITGKMIGGKSYEASVDCIETGTLDEKQALQFAHMLVLEAEDILWGFKKKRASDACGSAAEEVRVLADDA